MSENDNHEMQREWRAIVLDKLASLEKANTDAKLAQEASNKDLAKSIEEIKLSFVRQNTIDGMSKKIEDLEKFKWKLAGVALTIQVVWAVITLGLMYYQAIHPVVVTLPHATH